MYTAEEIKKNLLGCFEIFLFMRKGVERFGSSKLSAIKSFAVPLALTPLLLLSILAVQKQTPINILIGISTGHLVITTLLFLGFVYLFTKQYNRQEHFWRFITITNWINIFSVILLIPLVIGYFSGTPMAVFESYIIFKAILAYVYTAFVITICFKIPWELGGFISIVGIAISEHTLKLGFLLHANIMQGLA